MQTDRTCTVRCSGEATAAAAPASASALTGGSCQPGHCARTTQPSGQFCVKGRDGTEAMVAALCLRSWGVAVKVTRCVPGRKGG